MLAAASDGRHGVHVVPRFTFERGASLDALEVAYTTYGALSTTRDNAILVTHGTSGTRDSYRAFIGPGRALDTDRYLIVTVDAIGGGGSSAPSGGLGLDFPRYTIRDMVRGQHDLVANGLGLAGLLAVGGPSMGSFQALEWGIAYPAFARGLLLIVPAARSGRLFASIVDAMVAAVEGDPAWKRGRYTENPTAGLRRAGMIYFPWLYSDEWLERLRGQDEYARALCAVGEDWAANWDALDWMYRYLASRDHDIAGPFGGDVDAALSVIRARALVIPCASDRLLPPQGARLIYERLKGAVWAEIPSASGHRACGPSPGSLEYEFIAASIGRFLSELGAADEGAWLSRMAPRTHAKVPVRREIKPTN